MCVCPALMYFAPFYRFKYSQCVLRPFFLLRSVRRLYIVCILLYNVCCVKNLVVHCFVFTTTVTGMNFFWRMIDRLKNRREEESNRCCNERSNHVFDFSLKKVTNENVCVCN